MFRGGRFFKSIHRSVDNDNSVDVSESNGIRSMHLGNSTVQSSMRLSDPYALELAYTRGMMMFLLFAPDVKRILMLGLGGGSIPKYIHRHLPQVDMMRVLEINPRVIQVARSHFELPDNDSRLEVIEGDGVQYIREHADSTQLLIMDAYDSAGLPSELCSQDFFDHCAHALTPDGILAVNLWGSDRNFEMYLQRIEQSFDHRVLILPTGRPGNIVVFAFRRMPDELRWVELRARAKKLEQIHKVEFLEFLEKMRDNNPGTAHRLTLESRA